MIARYIAPPASLAPGAIVDTYVRDSGGDGQDRSVTSQLTEIKNFCAQHNLALRRVYSDIAKSGKSTHDRDEFDRLITDIENEIDNPHGLIIWDYARFARNTKDAVYNIALIENNNVTVHSLTDEIPDGEYRDLIRFVKHMGNEAERRKNSKAVRRELSQLVSQHRAMFGVPPRGFIREPLPAIRNERTGEMRIHHKWVPDPEAIPLVQRAFSMRASGATIPQIRTATGLYKTVGSYTTFFTNRLYIGELQFGDLTVTDYCEPVISKEIWDEVQRVSQRRRLPQSNIDNPRRVVSPFLLSGLIYCQECGSPMSGYSIRQWDYYLCSRRKAKHDCHSRRVPRLPIETEVIHLLEERMLSLDHLLNLQVKLKSAWDIHSQENGQARREEEIKLSRVQAQIRNTTNAIAEHGYSKALSNRLTALEGQEADHRAILAKFDAIIQPREYTRPQMAEIAEALKQDLHSDDIQQRRATLRGLVERVVAKRTDDQILGVMYCIPLNYKVVGQVPPWGGEAMTLFPITLQVRKRKAPLRT